MQGGVRVPTGGRIRLFGFVNNEKTASVIGGSSSTAGESDGNEDDDTTEAGPSGADAGEPAAGDADEDDGDRERRAKGHGRIPASAYPNAQVFGVPHEQSGQASPACASEVGGRDGHEETYLRRDLDHPPPLQKLCASATRSSVTPSPSSISNFLPSSSNRRTVRAAEQSRAIVRACTSKISR